MALASLLAACAPKSPLSQLFPPASKFDPTRDMGDLSDKVMLITGFTSGRGYQTALALVRANIGKLYLAARSPEKANQAIRDLEAQAQSQSQSFSSGPSKGEQLVFLQLDLGDLDSVARAAAKLRERNERIDVLFNNAGTAYAPLSAVTAQNYDLQFGTNVLGPFLFTELLWPCLLASHIRSGSPARIINTSSILHIQALSTSDGSGIDLETLIGGQRRDELVAKHSSKALYGQSKLGNIFASDYWSTKDPQQRVVSCALHPGVIITNIVAGNEVIPMLEAKTMAWLGSSAELGALTQLYAGSAAQDINGKYYIPWAREGKTSAQARNAETRELVVAWMKEQIKNYV